MILASEPTYLICVGATKAGTSWTYRQLRAHPECHFRSIKELHYFDMTRTAHFDQAGERLSARISALEAEIKTGAPADLAGKAERLGDLWDWAEVVGRGQTDLDAYRGFLEGGRDGQAVVGEVTPAYAMLPVGRLKAIAGLGRKLRVLFLMRDPLERVWSHVRMVAARTGAAFEATARALVAQLAAGDLTGEAQGIARRGDYRGIVGRLMAAFPAEALHFEFTERLTAAGGLARLWAFLGIGSAAMAEDRVYQSPKLEMTAAEAGALRRWLQPQYDFIAGLMPDLPQAWRANMGVSLA